MKKSDWYWRFEPDTYLAQALEAHYDNERLPDDAYHADILVCARYLIEWLESNKVELTYVGEPL